MKPILTSEQMAASDRYTIDELGIVGIELMEQAALACVDILLENLRPQAKIAVVTGVGNNGGDGFAIARLLANKGFNVTTYLSFPPEKLNGDAKSNYLRLTAMAVPIVPIENKDFCFPPDCDWFIDAIFGTGLNRPAMGLIAWVIQQMNAHSGHILSVDLPSGLSGSQGRLLGPAVKAHITVSFQSLKFVHVIAPASVHCGKVMVPDIGIQCPQSLQLNAFLLEASDYRRAPRSLETHKGSYGSLAVIGGFTGMEGAANLAARACLRFGTGKVRILTDGPSSRFSCDSVMVAHIKELKNTDPYQAMVIGPGLSRSPSVAGYLDKLDLTDQRVVWDADGLYYLNENPARAQGKIVVLTPHPGEAGMLLGKTAAQVQEDRLGAVRALGERFPQAWVLLKGYRTIILSPEGEIYVCSTGNAALAVAGSGDVLSGMIGALLAQGLPSDEAVLFAVIRHGMAGDRWVGQYRDYAMMAEDIIDDLRH